MRNYLSGFYCPKHWRKGAGIIFAAWLYCSSQLDRKHDSIFFFIKSKTASDVRILLFCSSVEAVPCCHSHVQRGTRECRAGPGSGGAELILGSSWAALGAGAAAGGSCCSWHRQAVKMRYTGKSCIYQIQQWPCLLFWCLVADHSKVWNSSKAVSSEPGGLSVPAGSAGWAEQPLLHTPGDQRVHTSVSMMCSTLAISVCEQAALVSIFSK